MPLTSAQQVRSKIQDVPTVQDFVRYGDGTAVVYIMPHVNLTTASAYVPLNATAWSATGATFDNSGQLTFANVISANSAFRVHYVQTVFSDDEVDNFLTEGGGVLGAALAACEALMFDAVKRARWMASDGTSYDDTSSQSHLRDMYEKLQEQVALEATTAGSFGSWAINQGDW